jgi:MAF protein
LFNTPFKVIPADINEDRIVDEHPREYVRRLACEKAVAVSAKYPGLVIAADTIVADGEDLLGKPGNQAEARNMLIQLRGRVHQVYTGIALLDSESGQSYSEVCCTNVPMRMYSDEEIETYIATGDPMDKAGAYAIQHAGFHPVENLRGCYASVMGLPLCHLGVGLQQLGYEIPQDLPQKCQQFIQYDCPVFEKIFGQSRGSSDV